LDYNTRTLMAIVEAINIPIGVTGQETVQQAANSYEDLGDAVAKTQLEAERLAQQFGINDAKTQEAIKVAGKYKQEMEQLDFAIDGARGGVDTLFRATQGVVAGFEVAVGAAALFGTESEQLEKVLMKVQGAMVLSQGLKDLKEFAPAMRQATTATLNWVKSLRLARVALAGLGIGAIIIAFQAFKDQLGGIIQFFKDLSDAAGLTNFAQEKLIKTQEGVVTSLQRELAVMEAKGESEDELFAKRLKIAQAEEVLAQQRLALLKEGEDGYEDAVNAAADASNNIVVVQETENKRLRELASEKAKEKREQMFSEAEERDAELALLQSDFERMLEVEQRLYDERGSIAEQNRKKIATENIKAQQEEVQALQNIRQEGLISEEEYYQKQEQLLKYYNEKKINADKEYQQAKRDLEEKSATELSQMLLDLNNIFQGQKEDQSRQEFERDKSFAIAQTLISTYFAAQKAYASQPEPILGTIAAAAAITSGLSRVASIRRVRYDDPNADKGSSGANATGQAIPRFNAPTTRLPQTDEFTQVRRVYVTERDITNVQDKVRVTESLSQF
jgi:hypothetical protein